MPRTVATSSVKENTLAALETTSLKDVFLVSVWEALRCFLYTHFPEAGTAHDRVPVGLRKARDLRINGHVGAWAW